MSRKKEKDIDWLIKNYMNFFKDFGMDEMNIRSYHNEWRLKYTKKVEDFAWHLFNNLLQENASQSTDAEGFYKRNYEIYLQMAHFRRVVEGQKANEIWEQINYNKLAYSYENSSIEVEALHIGVDDCEYSSELNGKSFPVEEILKTDIIPYKKCKRRQGCACCFALKPIRDSDGSLIRKNKKI